MFDYDEFIAKATLYFDRASEADEGSEERAVWLLLGLEFVLRAPLAQVHPTLLALPEGDSILHAAGVERARGVPRSIPIKSVIDRLTKIDPAFGEDRGKDAAFLVEIRNEELHSSAAAFHKTPEPVWMPKFLTVVEAICKHLKIEVAELLDEEIVEAAQTFRSTADAKVQGEVTQLKKAALTLLGGLTPEEITARAELPSPMLGSRRTQCPVCQREAAWLELGEGRTTVPNYNDDTQEITYKVLRVVTGLQCNVCGLRLHTTAQVVAAGLSRLESEEVSEDRYEGWEDMMTYEHAMEVLGAGEEYGNE